MIIRIVVVFPAPFGPSRPYTAPRGIVSERSSTAVKEPYRFETCWISTTESIAFPSLFGPEHHTANAAERIQPEYDGRNSPRFTRVPEE